ncbi:hypothetical protein NHX12_030310 [Muraenolepis orangiensis]|uniref:Uncharacterized protein n=1 Tax=Muraenolepis orangiensis TaxID=630683 RepID=A0A9Q0E9W8_9TELE|nr:hypothetical protein NHX12_030310 [Muraenolepis orangiensis]
MGHMILLYRVRPLAVGNQANEARCVVILMSNSLKQSINNCYNRFTTTPHLTSSSIKLQPSPVPTVPVLLLPVLTNPSAVTDGTIGRSAHTHTHKHQKHRDNRGLRVLAVEE